MNCLGMCIESLLSIEEMRTMVATAYGGNQERNPSKQLNEDEEEAAWHGTSSHMWFATDDVLGTPLDPRLVKKARQKEMKYFKEMGVYVKVSKQECWAQT